MDEKSIEQIEQLINLQKGDEGRLNYIQSSLRHDKRLYPSDQKYMENLIVKYIPKEKIKKKYETVTSSIAHETDALLLSHDKNNFREQKTQTVDPSNLEKIKPITQKSDHAKIVIGCAIFALLFVSAYFLFNRLSIVAISIAAGLVFFQIIKVKPHTSQFKHRKHGTSVYTTVMIASPFVISILIAYDGYDGLRSIIKIIYVWSMMFSFWQIMLFVPLAIKSSYRDNMIPTPKIYPMITVIVPAYNEEKVIANTICALLADNYTKKEIIVVDDGSKDKTLEVATRYKSQVKVLHKDNGGKATALNYALAFAKGEIVVIVDADTIIAKNALQELVKGFYNENIVAVAGNIKVRNRINWITWCQALEYLSGIQIMRRALDYFGTIPIVPGALGAFRKDILETVGTYHKDTLVEDFDATIKILKTGVTVQGSNKAISYTQAPHTIHDFYKQRTRWYRGNLQILSRHVDVITNPRFGNLQGFTFPLMLIQMLVLPITGITVWIVAIIQIIYGQWFFVAVMTLVFITLQYLLSTLAVLMDKDEKKLILYSVFLVIGFKQLTDILCIKAIIEEVMKKRAVWTSAERVRGT